MAGTLHHKRIARLLVDRAFPEWTGAQKGAAMRLFMPILDEAIVSMTADIREFHEKYGLAYDGGPRQLDWHTSNFRINFMQEELDEYKAAVKEGDLEKQFDALIDLAYVLFGTAYLQGLPFGEGWAEVHGKNMQKVRAINPDASKRGSSLDVVKPDGWTPPDLKKVLKPYYR